MGTHSVVQVVKQRRVGSDYDRRRFDVEAAANQLLAKHVSGVAPALRAVDSERLSLVFDLVPGGALAPASFVPDMDDDDVAALVTLAAGLESLLGPLTPLPDTHALTVPVEWLGQPSSLLPEQLARLVLDGAVARALAHGDLFPSNVMRGPGGLVPVDWQWCGLYPPGWDLASVVVATLFHPTAVDAATNWCGQHPTRQQIGFVVGLAVLCIREAAGRSTQPPQQVSELLATRGHLLHMWASQLLAEPPTGCLDLSTLATSDEEAVLAARSLAGLASSKEHTG